MNTSTKLELLRRSVGPWYVAVFSSFQMFFLLVCCHHFLWIQVLIFWRSMVRCYGQHLIMEITRYILKNSVVHSLCFTSGLQSTDLILLWPIFWPFANQDVTVGKQRLLQKWHWSRIWSRFHFQLHQEFTGIKIHWCCIIFIPM